MKIKLAFLGLALMGASGLAAAQGLKGEDADVVMRQNGLPLIAYRDIDGGTRSLRVVDCLNSDCSVGTAGARFDSTSISGSGRPRIELRNDGRALIAYQAGTMGGLRVFDCADVACTTGTVRPLDLEGSAGAIGIDIAIRPTGEPLIVYGDSEGAVRMMKVYDCDDVNCTTGTARIPAGQLGLTSDATAIAMRSSGLAVLSSEARGVNSQNRTGVYDCADSGCTSGTITYYERSAEARAAIRSDDTAFIAYGQNGIKGLSCDDEGCTTATTATLEIATNAGLAMMSLAMRPLDLPMVPNVDFNGDLKVFDCDDPDCFISNERILDNISVLSTQPTTSIALRADGTPILVYTETTPGDNFQRLLVARCDDVDCISSSFGPILPDGLFKDGFE